MDIVAVIFALVGLMVGMLVNYLSDILPLEPLVAQPSCRNVECRQPFHWRDYLLLRRCTKCKKVRNVRTWILLVLMVAAGAFLWLIPPKGIGPFGGLGLLAYLLTVAIIDLETHLILRPLSIAGLVICGGAGLITNGWKETLIGGAIGFVSVYMVFLLGKLYSRIRFGSGGVGEDVFASGDITLALLLGLLVGGWELITLNLILGILLSGLAGVLVIIGSLIARRSGRQALMTFIPLGPGFILATILIIYFPFLLSRLVPM